MHGAVCPVYGRLATKLNTRLSTLVTNRRRIVVESLMSCCIVDVNVAAIKQWVGVERGSVKNECFVLSSRLNIPVSSLGCQERHRLTASFSSRANRARGKVLLEQTSDCR